MHLSVRPSVHLTVCLHWSIWSQQNPLEITTFFETGCMGEKLGSFLLLFSAYPTSSLPHLPAQELILYRCLSMHLSVCPSVLLSTYFCSQQNPLKINNFFETGSMGGKLNFSSLLFSAYPTSDLPHLPKNSSCPAAYSCTYLSIHLCLCLSVCFGLFVAKRNHWKLTFLWNWMYGREAEPFLGTLLSPPGFQSAPPAI